MIVESTSWPELRELWTAVRASASLSTCAAEIFAQAQLYGFPVSARDEGVLRVEGLIDREFVASTAATDPFAAMVLEIAHNGMTHAFRSLLVAPSSADGEEQLRVATYVLRHLVAGLGDRLDVRVRFDHGSAQAAAAVAPLSSVLVTRVPANAVATATASIANVTLSSPSRVLLGIQLDASRAHTPVLEISFMPNPQHLAEDSFLLAQHRDSGKPYFGQVASKLPHSGMMLLTVPAEYVPCVLYYIEHGVHSVANKSIWNERGFPDAFFSRIEKFLYRSFLLPLYPIHGTQHQAADTHPEVIPRNLLVLNVVANFDGSDKSALVRHIGQLFYSSLLEPATSRFWMTRIGWCLDANFSDEDAQVRVLDENTMRAVRNCWESWLACNWTPEQLAKERNNFFVRTRGFKAGRDHVEAAVDQFMDTTLVVNGGAAADPVADGTFPNYLM
ncbi:hypothetical protein H9P43_006308 [Blastocladiella emersonii ATCC 22665]|nr:hypothetical protein H9P43_006308 [Blastocladiella emersonii ATCC 22665]